VGPNAHSGNVSYAPNGVGGSDATVQQLLSTITGQGYDLSFYYEWDPNSPLSVSFGGAAVNITYLTTGGWQLATATDLVASSTNTILAFTTAGGDTHLDDVSVTLTATTTPEPTSLMLLASSLSGLGLFKIAKRRIGR
jgi:hypothetical protein